jgi:hypothetical protein
MRFCQRPNDERNRLTADTVQTPQCETAQGRVHRRPSLTDDTEGSCTIGSGGPGRGTLVSGTVVAWMRFASSTCAEWSTHARFCGRDRCICTRSCSNKHTLPKKLIVACFCVSSKVDFYNFIRWYWEMLRINPPPPTCSNKHTLVSRSYRSNDIYILF